MTGIHKDSERRWNLWFPSAGVFAKVLAGRGGDADYLPLVHVVDAVLHYTLGFAKLQCIPKKTVVYYD